MKISTENEHLIQEFGYHKAIDMVAEAGFDCMDMSMLGMAKGEDSRFLQADALEFCKELRRHAEDVGITINQAHAPFQMDMQEWMEGNRADILRRINKSIELAGVLGIRNIVVHPIKHIDYLNSDPAWYKDVNVDFYSQLIPAARDAGVKIAIENMWHRHKYNKNIVVSVCSSPYEHRDYIDTCNAIAPVFTACLDVGHCVLTGHDPAKSIEVLGDRLDALHVHDVDGINDSHSCPLTLTVDFWSIVEKLKEIGYKGEFTLESVHYFKHFNPEDYPKALRHMAEVARILTN